jgi:hypothetical protein
MGANGRQTRENCENCCLATARCSASIRRLAFTVGCPLTVGYT